ncbi:CpmK protein [Brenneria populi]|uniref:CpmK protein n=1 Tax=Brenneria populi TaxID=1505588 RepID=A0ABU6JU15_9GAMM|nr:CpmK protein [Brenneria populi Li et al. 2015]
MKFFIFLAMLVPFCGYAQSTPVDKYIKKIQTALDRQPALCLGERRWPVAIDRSGVSASWINGKMESLVDAGLIKSRFSGDKKVWEPTPAGLKELKKHGDFCYGRIMVKEIESITPESNGAGVIIFNYSIASLPAWAKNRSVRVAYTDLDNLVTGVNSTRYQVKYRRIGPEAIKIVGEPEQLDLLY